MNSKESIQLFKRLCFDKEMNALIEEKNWII